jgi:uncharacterized small protein (DUF1192 family)
MNEREPFDQWWVDQVRQLDELSLYDLSRRAWQAATLAEQERCAKIADEIERLRAERDALRDALDKIAERTGSDDPCATYVQIARSALRVYAAIRRGEAP